MNEVNNQFIVSGTVVDGWKPYQAGNYQAYELWVETSTQFPQTLRIRFFERRDLNVDFRANVVGCAVIVKGYVKSNIFTNKKGEKDIFTNLIGCQFSLIDNIAEQRDTPYVPNYNENFKPRNVEQPQEEYKPKVEKKSYKDYLPKQEQKEEKVEETPKSYIPKDKPKDDEYKPDIPEGYKGDPDDLPF